MSKIISKPHMKLAVGLFVIPGLLITISLIILLPLNLIFNPTFWMTPDTDPVNSTPFIISVLNGVFIVIEGIGLICLVPGIVAGACVYASQKRSIVGDASS